MNTSKTQKMGFHHIGLKCADLKKSEEFYKAIGLKEVVRWGEGEKEIVMYEYDEYTFLLKDKDGLKDEIEANMTDWLITGRTLEINESASIIRDMKEALEILEVNVE